MSDFYIKLARPFTEDSSSILATRNKPFLPISVQSHDVAKNEAGVSPERGERELASEVDGAKTSAALIVFEREALGK